MTDDRLLPCPFCGMPVELSLDPDGGRLCMLHRCDVGGIVVETGAFGSLDELVGQWNTRGA